MPRENIRSTHGDPDVAGPELTISWGRDEESVQLATVHHEPIVRERLGERLADVELSDEQRAAVVEALSGPHSGVMGWYVHLSRGSLNQAIRILRKARDQACGADA